MRVACFSVAVLDTFSQRGECHAGGNAFNQAIAFREMGYETAFMGAMGTDTAGDRLEDLLRLHDVDVSRLYRMEGCTASNEIINDEYGERFGVNGSWSGGVYESFCLSEADWAYLKKFDTWITHAGCPDLDAALERKQPHQFLSIDFLDLDDYPLLERCLASADIVFVGGSEAMTDSIAAIAEKTKRLVVLTLGAMGSIAFDGSTKYEQAALPLDEVIDTTGCGDAFQAAFTAAYIRDRDIPAALIAGAIGGRDRAMEFGAVPWRGRGKMTL